ncbi:MAG: hypothetical protein JJT96_19205 [Opitutales bacterium]|nr:hypothetical protein [Opitutales bacterium]
MKPGWDVHIEPIQGTRLPINMMILLPNSSKNPDFRQPAMMTPTQLETRLSELLKRWEGECVEFKEANDNIPIKG